MLNDLQSNNDDVKKALMYRKNGYTLKDSSMGFVFGGYVSPIIIALIVSIIVSIIATIGGTDYKELVETKAISVIFLLVAELGFFCYFLYVQIKNRNKRDLKSSISFSFKKLNWIICVIIVLFAIVMSYFTNGFIALINHGLELIGYSKSTGLPFEINTVGNMILGLVVMALIPAICEELLFRGVVLGGMLNFARTKKARIICVLLSALFFALIHQNTLQLFYPFLMGVIFGFIYMITGNLIYNMLLHFISNGFVIVMNYIYYANGIANETITYNTSFILGAIGMFILSLGLAVLVILLIKKLNKEKSPFLCGDEVKEFENEEIINSLSENEASDNSLNNLNSKKQNEIYNSSKIIYIIGIVVGVALIVFDLVSNIK